MKHAVLFFLASCSAAHGPVPIDPIDPIDPVPVDPTISQMPIGTQPGQVVAPPAGALDACLLGGGELVEVDSVDNNDVEDHGSLLTFGISEAGLLAAAGADGTLKFWTLDAELLATVDGSLLTYGSEEGRTPITDLAFFGENVLAGDIRGLVAQMSSDGSFFPVAGTTPDVPIRSVAFHAETRRLAHAQLDAMRLVVRKMEAPDIWEIADTLDTPNDVAFAPSGELFVVGQNGGRATIEVRDAVDPTSVLDAHEYFTTAPIAEVQFARSAPIGAAISESAFYLIRGLSPFQSIRHRGGVSVDLTPSGAFAFTVGSDGRLAATSTESGDIVADVEVASPVKVRVDATGTLVLVGSEDAIIHVFSCAAP